MKKARRVAGFVEQVDRALLSSGEPIAGVKWAAHAQRQGRYIHQFVGGHHLAAFVCLLGLAGPFPLANFRGTGYRKE